MRRTKLEAEKTKNTILDAALKIFSKHGYGSSKLEGIAKEANVTRGAIYWHFKNKQDLFVSLLNRSDYSSGKLVTDILSSTLTPLEKIRKIIKAFIVKLVNDERYREFERIVFFKVDDEEISEYMSKVHEKSMQETLYILNSLLKEAVKEKEVRENIDFEMAAKAIYAYMGGVQMMLLYVDNYFDAEEKADEIVNVFINGLI